MNHKCSQCKECGKTKDYLLCFHNSIGKTDHSKRLCEDCGGKPRITKEVRQKHGGDPF